MKKPQTIRLDTLHPDPRNPRKIKDADFDNLCRLVARYPKFMALRPIVIDADGRIVAGTQRHKACLKNGMTEVPADWVRRATDLTPDELKAFQVVDNVSAGFFDMEILTADWDIPDLEALGVDCGEFKTEDETDADAEPQGARSEELNKVWQVKPGDLWLIGLHKLLCGDSTSAADVGRVMREEKAVAILTDPPYGQNQKGVENDSPETHTGLMKAAVDVLPITDGVIVAFQSPRTFHAWTDAARAKGFIFERMLWLYKAAQCTFPWRGWILKSESIPVCSIGKPDWQDVHPFSHDCYYLAEVSGELNADAGWHGSVKPLSVVSDLLKRISPPDSIVFDGFAGSGTTLVACENHGRRCRAIERHVPSCAVILERMKTAFPMLKIEKG